MILALLKVGAIASSFGFAVVAAMLGLSTMTVEDRASMATGVVLCALTSMAAALLALWAVTS